MAKTPGRPGKPPGPAQWAKDVRKDYQLDATDEQLVLAGQFALRVANDLTEKAITRLNASGRFQSIVRQLALGRSVARERAEKATPVAPAPRPRQVRTGGDPRGLLHAVTPVANVQGADRRDGW
jgi:ribosomal protein S14